MHLQIANRQSVDTLTLGYLGSRFIAAQIGGDIRSSTSARLVLLDSNQPQREALMRALCEIGAFEIAGIATVADTSSSLDLFLIEGLSLFANDAGWGNSPNPFAASAILTILMLPQPPNEQRRAALFGGYTVVFSTPVPSRLLYRRIAQLLQNARRRTRREGAISDRTRQQQLKEMKPQTLSVELASSGFSPQRIDAYPKTPRRF